MTKQAMAGLRPVLLAGLVFGVGAHELSGQEILHTLTGNQRGDFLSKPILDLDDIDADGVRDFLVGAEGAADYRGQVYAVSGKDGSVLYTVTGPPRSLIGFAGKTIAQVGDVDADGIEDFLVGAFADMDATGTAFVYSGVSGKLLHEIPGQATLEDFGFAAAPLADHDGDGVVDFLVSAILVNGAGGAHAGVVRWISGADGSILQEIEGRGERDFFGSDLATIEDVDGDGVPDFAATADDVDIAGRVELRSGGSGALLWERTGNRLDSLGGSLDRMPDIDGDGISELVAGAFNADGGDGYAEVLSGADGSLLFTRRDDDVKSFGFRVSGAEDVNGDGFADFLVATFDSSYFASEPGEVFLFSGRTGNRLYRFLGEAPKIGYALGVEGLGDLDSDGYPEIAIGVFNYPDIERSFGQLRVHRGAPLFLDITPRSLAGGDEVRFRHAEGVPGKPVLLAVVEQNGAPMFHALTVGAFDRSRVFVFQATTPPGLGSMELGFQAFTVDANGRLIQTAVERLELE